MPGQEFICLTTSTASWAKGQLSAACGLLALPDSIVQTVQVGDRLKVKIDEFNFEQVVVVTSLPENRAHNGGPAVKRIGDTRLVLAPADCSGWTGTGELAQQLYQAGEIILYRLRSALSGPTIEGVEPVVFIDECAITVELPPLGDPTPYIQLIQQPGRFELIDSGTDYHAPGVVLRTTDHPSPTVPISTALQAAIPYKRYEVIATNADLDLNFLSIVVSGNNSPQLDVSFREAAAQKLAKVTAARSISTKSSQPYYVCILLDNMVEDCPSISKVHLNGRVVFRFSDSFTAERLSSILRNGILPLELKIIKTETIYSETTN